MPSHSAKQHRFMEAVANNPSFAKKAGVPQSVGMEYEKADKGRKFGSGVATRVDRQVVNKPKTDHGGQALFKRGGDMAGKMNPGMMAMMAKKKDGMHKMPDGKMMKDSAMKKGGMAMVMKDGKKMPAFAADGKGAMKHGGMAKKMMGGGMAYAKGGGIETKGKTKGTMIKMKSGGKMC